ncbi:MAG: hypothetical protein ABGZ35_26610, partial [Planctomycetaceae bacterium]
MLQNSQGSQPDVILDDIFPEGIVGIAYAAEARTLLVGTSAGTLTLLSSDGTLLKTNRSFEGRCLFYRQAGVKKCKQKNNNFMFEFGTFKLVL